MKTEYPRGLGSEAFAGLSRIEYNFGGNKVAWWFAWKINEFEKAFFAVISLLEGILKNALALLNSFTLLSKQHRRYGFAMANMELQKTGCLLASSTRRLARQRSSRLRGRRLHIESLEHRCLLASVSGYVWDDTANNDGVRGNLLDEPGIIGSNLLLTGTDDLGKKVSLTSITDAQGAYSFLNLRPGTYSLSDDVPAGYRNGKNSLGSLGGTAGENEFGNITLNEGDDGANYDFGKLMRYDVNPAVAYTIVLRKPIGTLVPVNSKGEYHLCQGDSFVIEVYAADIRRGIDHESGGVASAHAKLFYMPDFMDFLPGSLHISPAFGMAVSGSLNEPMGRVEDAGGTFDLSANGGELPGAAAPQLLFSVECQVPITVASTTTAVLQLLPADDTALKTTVFGIDTPVFGSFQNLVVQVGSPWRNSSNPWDVNRDWTVDALDELAVVNALADGGPRQLPETIPPTAPLVDLNGDGVLNYLDALAIHQHLYSSWNTVSQDATPTTESASQLPVERTTSTSAINLAGNLKIVPLLLKDTTAPASDSNTAKVSVKSMSLPAGQSSPSNTDHIRAVFAAMARESKSIDYGACVSHFNGDIKANINLINLEHHRSDTIQRTNFHSFSAQSSLGKSIVTYKKRSFPPPLNYSNTSPNGEQVPLCQIEDSSPLFVECSQSPRDRKPRTTGRIDLG